jgi:hypothetical protein
MPNTKALENNKAYFLTPMGLVSGIISKPTTEETELLLEKQGGGLTETLTHRSLRAVRTSWGKC